MAKCNNWPIGVCSWSLGDDLDALAQVREKLLLDYVNLNIGPGLTEEGKGFPVAVQKQGWKISCTMIGFAQEDYSTLDSIKATGGIVPDEYWEENRRRVLDAINLTADLDVRYLLFHFGFIPGHMDVLVDRVKQLADMAAQKNVTILMETGQESAQELKVFLELLNNHPNMGINYDPANMIIYDTDDPIKALKVLAPWIRHIHIKDAVRTKIAGQFGREVPWGSGQVGAKAFLEGLKEIGFSGVLAVERETGGDRVNDIKHTVENLQLST